jgi:hypothetical protein
MLILKPCAGDSTSLGGHYFFVRSLKIEIHFFNQLGRVVFTGESPECE